MQVVSKWIKEREMAFDRHTELQLLEALEEDPETSQADLAARVGVAVGTVNWYLKRWSKKGYVKVKRIGRWRWRYILTPPGLAEKTRLTARYIEASMSIYRRARTQAKVLLEEVRQAGFDTVVIQGDGDIVDIIELTCLEMGLKVAQDKNDENPKLILNGLDMEVVWQNEDPRC